MLKFLLDFFRPPIFEDEDLTLRAQLLNALILSVFIALPVMIIGNLFTAAPNPFIYWASGLGLLLAVGIRALMHQGQVYWASVLWVGLALGFVTTGIVVLGTVRATNTYIFLLDIAVAGFLLNRRAVILVAAYSFFAVVLLGSAQNLGWLPVNSNMPDMSVSVAFNFLALIIGTTLLMIVSVRVMNRMIETARNEVAERHKTVQTLRQRDAIMQAATFAAHRFLQASDWRAEIARVLEELGNATNSSHVFIFENHALEDGTEVTSQRHEWTAPNMKADLHNPLYQNARLRAPGTEAWFEAMISGEAFYGTRDILSPVEIEIYMEEGLLSFINVPIYVGERWWGIMGFDDYVSEREWTAVEIEAVKITASTLGAAIQHQFNNEALARRDAILQAVNFAAQQFFQAEDWRTHIQAVLEQLGRATQSSHAYIFEKHVLPNGTPVISQRYEWVVEGVQPDLDDPEFQEIEIFHSHSDPWFEQLARGEVCFGNLKTLPPVESEFFVRRGVKALIDAPILVDNQWWGVIGFDDCFTLREWDAAEVDAIRIAARTLGVAIQRQMSDEASRQRDLQYRTELEERVQERTHQLAEALHEIESVSYTASHDLRAPVRAINGYANILLREFSQRLNTEEYEYLQKIARESRRMGNLLDDLIRLIQINRQTMRISRVNLSELAPKTAERLRRQFPTQTVALNFQPDLLVQGDQEMLQMVLDELLDNAWKFSAQHPQPQITLGMMPSHPHPVYYIQDNGIGFEMVYAHKLFRNFEQLHLPGTYEGTGMGLAIVQRIIQRHQGKVWAEGVPGEGAKFFFTLPDAEAEKA
ncbi:MAG: GAF domain-containing protein [Anaerolineales bacterium]|nr:GAF domain-containing protein [Anaerolineales bacterium]